jgi:hypothetical protein
MPTNLLDLKPVETPIAAATEEIPVDPLQAELFTFEKAKSRINSLIDSFNEEKAIIRRLRKERYADVDVAELRETGELENDETFIPDRVIDNNITRDLPDAVSFLTGSHRLAIFRCLSNPDINTRRLELEFTKGLTYNGWYRPFFRSFDGASLHGWDAVEVVFDPTKPLHVGFEHIGTDKLYFAKDVSDIQESEYCIREYSVSLMRLESYVDKNGFDSNQVKLISEAYKDSKRDKKVTIFKVYFKYNNCVYIAWHCREGGVNSWLKSPDKLKLGIKELQQVEQMVDVVEQDLMTGLPNIRQVPQIVEQFVDKEIDSYPIFLYIYKDDENETIVEHKGRGFLDGPVQEATIAVITGFVNAVVRASNIYASTTGPSDDANIRQLDVKLEHGGIYSSSLNFFHTPMPDVMVLQSLQYLNTKNASDTGKVAAAVMNRKDSRKTAEELQQANTQQQKISGTSLTTLSEFLREIFTFSWQIIKSQGEQDLIDFLLVSQPDVTGSVTYTNDINTITQVYDIRPAGDDDIIKAEELVAKMMVDWPVIQLTPLKDIFLQDLISLRYPEKADKYIPILQSSDPKQLVMSLSTLLTSFISKQDLAMLSPQELMQLQQIQQQVQIYLGAQQNAIQQNNGQNQGSRTSSTGTGPQQGPVNPATQTMAQAS